MKIKNKIIINHQYINVVEPVHIFLPFLDRPKFDFNDPSHTFALPWPPWRLHDPALGFPDLPWALSAFLSPLWALPGHIWANSQPQSGPDVTTNVGLKNDRSLKPKNRLPEFFLKPKVSNNTKKYKYASEFKKSLDTLMNIHFGIEEAFNTSKTFRNSKAIWIANTPPPELEETLL